MKYKKFSIALFATLFFSVLPSIVRAEYIDSFISDIFIAKDGTAVVTENISYVFTEARHGMFRCIPTLHEDRASSALRERYIDIDITSVFMDNHEVPYTVDDGSDKVCIKIGDPASTVSGTHIYQIVYSVGGAVSYQEYGGADWYWNVTGNEWEVPIRSIEAYVSSAEPILLRERACYRGTVGKSDSCQIVTEANGQIHFSGTQFNVGEGVTIAQALDRSKIPYDVRERYRMILLLFFFGTIALLVSGYALYKYKTKFKTGNTIIPQYEPYPEVKPMYAGFLFDKKLDPRDITAGIVYLAEQGFIKIKKIDRKVLFFFEVDDYEITLTSKPFENSIGEFDKRILALLFDGFTMSKGTVTLSELKNDYQRQRVNYALLRSLKNDLEKDLKNNGFFTGFIFTRRTRKGYEALDHLKGFKDFLRVTETQRYIFHNAPQKNAEQFMEYLPYAIAFGVEKEWAKTFEGITIPNPDWYDGGGNMNTFSAVGLSQSLGGFSSAFSASSGASGSASSGGGSSGGGGGGGGGGSW